MFTLFIFIAVLAVLVLSHEFGHFIVAKKSGMKVFEFGFGLPPRAFGFYRDPETKKWKFVNGNFDRETAPATIYSLNWLPVGGFVQIKGENENADVSPDGFGGQKFWKKCLTISAGVIMNVIVAMILLSVGYLIGAPQAVDNIEGPAVSNRRTEILQVMAGRPAAEAELQSGDVFVKVGELDYPRLKDLQNYTNTHSAGEIAVTVARGSEMITKNIRPTIYQDTGKAGFGVAVAEIGTVKYNMFQALYHGFIDTFVYLKAIVVAFYNLIAGIFAGSGVGESVSGPVGIAVMSGKAARMGWSYLIQFTALLSLNLAIFNVLPFPALDGGRLLFLVIGKLKGSPVNPKWEQLSHSIGYGLLLLLFVVVTARDLSGFGAKVVGLVERIF